MDKSKFPDENTTEFEDGNLPKEFSPDLINYINEKAQEMEINYMKNGLSREEVELRKNIWSKLPTRKEENSWNYFIFRRNYFNIFSTFMDSSSFKFFSLWLRSGRKK